MTKTMTKRRLLPPLLGLCGLLAACASDTVTERTRLPYIDAPAPAPLAVPPTPAVPAEQGREGTTKSLEVTQ